MRIRALASVLFPSSAMGLFRAGRRIAIQFHFGIMKMKFIFIWNFEPD